MIELHVALDVDRNTEKEQKKKTFSHIQSTNELSESIGSFLENDKVELSILRAFECDIWNARVTKESDTTQLITDIAASHSLKQIRQVRDNALGS